MPGGGGGGGSTGADDSPPSLTLSPAPPPREGLKQEEHVHEEGEVAVAAEEAGFVPYQAGGDLVDQQTVGYHVRAHERPPPLYHATLGLSTTYRHVTERRGKVRPRGGWAGTGTADTRCYTSADGSLRLGPHLPLVMGRYKHLRLVGQGTFAQIICAEDTFHPERRQVAIKILNFHYGEVGKREALCLRVARDHPAAGPTTQRRHRAGIVGFLGAFDFMGHFCLVMELCQGGSLQNYLRPLGEAQLQQQLLPQHNTVGALAAPPIPIGGPQVVLDGGGGGGGPGSRRGSMIEEEQQVGLQPEQLREVALDLVKALLLLHNVDVIHADLKPENVLLAGPWKEHRGRLGGQVRLTDLGNAIKSREVRLYQEDYEIQTLGYRAPEVLVGGCGGAAFDHRIDMWSLGVLLAELHLGRPLFRAASKMLMVKRIVSILGPLPAASFATGKFYTALFGPDHGLRPEALALRDDPVHAATAQLDPASVRNSFRYDAGQHHRLVRDLLRSRDPEFLGFVGGLLQLDPAARLTSFQALMHPYLAPCFPFGLLRPFLGDAAVAGLRAQQERQQYGDTHGGVGGRKIRVIKPGKLWPDADDAVSAVKAEEEEDEDEEAAAAVAARAAAAADADTPRPTPDSTPALSLAPPSPLLEGGAAASPPPLPLVSSPSSSAASSPPPLAVSRKRPRTEGGGAEGGGSGEQDDTGDVVGRKPRASEGAKPKATATAAAPRWYDAGKEENDDDDDDDDDDDLALDISEPPAAMAAAARRRPDKARAAKSLPVLDQAQDEEGDEDEEDVLYL